MKDLRERRDVERHCNQEENKQVETEPYKTSVKEVLRYAVRSNSQRTVESNVPFPGKKKESSQGIYCWQIRSFGKKKK